MSAGMNMAITGSTAASAATVSSAGNAQDSGGEESSGARSSFLSTLENVGQSAGQGAGQKPDAKAGEPSEDAASAQAQAQAPGAGQAAGAEANDLTARADRKATDKGTDAKATDKGNDGSTPEAGAAMAATMAQLLAAAKPVAPTIAPSAASAGDATTGPPGSIAPLLAGLVAGTGVSTDTGKAGATPARTAVAGATASIDATAAANPPTPNTSGSDGRDALSLALAAPSKDSARSGADQHVAADGQGGSDTGFRALASMLAASPAAANTTDFSALLATGAAQSVPAAGAAAGAQGPLTTAPPATDPFAQPRLQEPVGGGRWADELGARLTLMATRGEQHGALRLSPEHLGPLEVQIRTQDDKASVWFGASHADTRAALQEALPRLRELFAASGMQLGDAGVSREAPRQARTPGTDNTGGPARRTLREETLVLPTARVLRHTGSLDTYA
jgi:flagellar hook-length control protein FliK